MLRYPVFIVQTGYGWIEGPTSNTLLSVVALLLSMLGEGMENDRYRQLLLRVQGFFHSDPVTLPLE